MTDDDRLTAASTVEIVPISVAALRADCSGNTVREMADLAYHAFQEPPWRDDRATSRLQFGIGVDLMRYHAKALIARSSASRKTVGYVLGYEVVREGDGLHKLTLADISGTDAVEDFLPDQTRVFYVDTICVDRGFRRLHVAQRLCTSLNEALRRDGFDFHISRTHVTAQAARGLCAKLNFQELPVVDRAFPDRTFWLLRLS